MTIKIVDFTEEYEKDVIAFNNRLASGNISFCFPAKALPERNVPSEEKKYPTEFFYLAVDDSHFVRGAYIYHEHQFIIKGTVHTLGNIQLPLSEGTINKAHNMVGISLVKHAQARNRYMYALGMGGTNGPFAKLLSAMKWKISLIPFYFSILNPNSFLKQISVLRTSRIRSRILDFFAASGLGWLLYWMFKCLKSIDVLAIKRTKCLPVSGFGTWAEGIWNDVGCRYQFSSVRNAETLQHIYKDNPAGYKHVQIMQSGKTVGWATLLDITEPNSEYFGNMRVMCMITCHCCAGEETALVNAIKRFVRVLGFDLLVGNFSYEKYQSALKRNGFLKGPSNLALAVSPALEKLFIEESITLDQMHITRGDGDGR